MCECFAVCGSAVLKDASIVLHSMFMFSFPFVGWDFFFAVLESEPQSLTFPFNSTTLFIYIRNNMNALRQNSY